MSRQGRTDFDRVDDEVELARQTEVDRDLKDIPADWYKRAGLETGAPVPPAAEGKQPVTVQLDADVIAFFKAQGRGWQIRMNSVLRAFVDGQERHLR